MKFGRVSRLILTIAALLICTPANAQGFYKYELDGKVWIGNYCPRRAKRCKLIMKIPNTAKQEKSKENSSAKPDSHSKKSNRSRHPRYAWSPPDPLSPTGSPKPKFKTKEDIDRIVEQAAKIYKIPAELIKAIIMVESSYKVYALSSKGAMGLMQLMPSTAKRLGVTDPYDPYQNIMGGTKLLRLLANKFNGDIVKVLSAYHAGGKAVEDKGGIPYVGTDGYVRKVLRYYYQLKEANKAKSRLSFKIR